MLDMIIKTKDEINEYKNIEYKIDNDILEFIIEEEKYLYDIKNNTFKKDNKDMTLLFNFKEGLETDCDFYIKELNMNIDSKIKTNKINKEDKKININYDYYLNDELINNFNLIIEMR